MRSPAIAIAWEFRRRHRWGLIALAGYVLFVAAFKLLILGPGNTLKLDLPDSMPAALIVPFSALFMYFLAVFSFGLAGDLLARQSIYPSRMFTLPVPTAALAGWPMLYGTAVMVSLWLATTLLTRWPWGSDGPLIWPALLAAAFLAWTQALMWMPYGLPGLRMIVAVLWLATLGVVVILAIHYKTSEPLMVAFLAPQLPLAYLAACAAVARARRGDVPDWREILSRLGPIANLLPRRQKDFSSVARAQAWLEWRQHGRSLPVWVAILLPFELALLFVAGSDSPSLVFWTLLGVLLTPVFMAAFTAPAAPVSDAHARDAYGLTPFLATRPLTSAALVAAKLKMALRSTLAAWLLVLAAIPVALSWSGTWPVVIEWGRRAIDVIGAPRAVVVMMLGFLGLLVSTWKQMVQALTIGLTGRGWLVKASVFLRVSLLVAAVPIIDWIATRNGLAFLWNAFPWLLAGLVGCKMVAAVWIATRLERSRLLGERLLVIGAAGWLVVVLVLYGLLVWLAATPLIPRYFPALIAILAVPLARLSAAPLALAWNRHWGTQRPATPTMSGRQMTLGVVLALLGLPVALALAEAVSFHTLNRSNGTLFSSGQEREYLLYVPRGYDRTKPTPLVISLHGGAGWPAAQKETSQWNTVAESEGFIVVYPSGIGGRGPRAWNLSGGAGLRDVRFISELIDSLSAAYNIDPARIYADGLSNGGAMAFVLSCTLSDRIAAVGMVASAQFLPFRWCKDQRAVPMIMFHGTSDRTVPYHGGTSWVAPHFSFPDVPTWVANWALRNQCDPNPIEATVAADVTRLEYKNCADDAAVVLYTIKGGGHSWPGGKPPPEWLAGRTSDSIDASRLTWELFREHPLSRK